MVLGQRIDIVNKFIHTIKRPCQHKNNASPVDIVYNLCKTLKTNRKLLTDVWITMLIGGYGIPAIPSYVFISSFNTHLLLLFTNLLITC